MIFRLARGSRVVRLALAATATALAGACTTDPGYGGRSSDQWLAALGDPDPRVRAHAASALGNVLRLQPRFPRVVAALVATLRDTSDAVRLAAAYALAVEGVRTPAAIPGLVAALKDSAHPPVREQAAFVLGLFGERSTSAVPALAAATRDAEASVRAAVAGALGMIGPGATLVVPEMNRLSQDPDPAVRLKAVEAVLNIRPPISHSLPILRRALSDSAGNVRMAAAYALGSLETAASPAKDELLVLLSDADASVRAAAAFALGSIGPDAVAALATLTELASTDSSQRVRALAHEAVLGVQGTRDPSRRPAEPTRMERCARGDRSRGC